MLAACSRAQAFVAKKCQNIASFPVVSLLAGVLWLSVCSQLTIPLAPVPLTLQTFGVFVWALALTSPLKSWSTVAAWILCGMGGLPCFADGAGGLLALMGPTGGYIVGMLVAAPVITWIGGQSRQSRIMKLAAGGAGAVVTLCLGFSWLAYTVGSARVAWIAGVQPFLLGETLKVFMAVSLVTIGRQCLKKA